MRQRVDGRQQPFQPLDRQHHEHRRPDAALPPQNLLPDTQPAVSVSVLKPLAVCAPGAAIFACGLALASYSLNLRSRTVILGSLVCVVLQPAVFFVALKAWGLKSAMAKAAFVASAMPTSTPSALFAQQYGKCEVETASIMLLTTLGMVVVIPATVAICEWI